MHLTVGTAGHIDHGKTTLVRALTGVDTDRLPEEKQRGITIDLGFAELAEDGAVISFVDVPGHERFVKNMLAGASGIDMVLLVIAADEGVMPQAREHFEICRLLQVGRGIVAITKTDAADSELIDLVKLEIAELVEGSFLEGAPVIEASARTGKGIAELRGALVKAAGELPERADRYITRLPIDRSFTMKGFGAVVTGTLASGTISEGDEMELLPGGERVRVRGIQTHGKAVKRAEPGRRTAVNLGGIDHHKIKRGMLLAAPGVLRATQMIDVEIEVLKSAPRPMRSRQRARVHLGTAEILARIAVLNADGVIEPGGRGYVQLRLETPVHTVPGERFIIRSYSPQTTIAGGSVLLNSPEKHRPAHAEAISMFLAEIAAADAGRTVRLLLESGGELDPAELQARTGWQSGVLEAAVGKALRDGEASDAGGVYMTTQSYNAAFAATLAEIEAHHKSEPLSPGISREMLQARLFAHSRPEVFRAIVRDLESKGLVRSDGTWVKLASYSAELSDKDNQILDRIRASLAAAGLQVPKADELTSAAAAETKSTDAAVKKLIQFLLRTGELTKVTDDHLFLTSDIEKLTGALREYASRSEDRAIDVAAFKEIAGISRKYAIPLLEFFDREKITRRDGDRRIVT